MDGHGGQLALAALRAWNVDELFTLSGGHIFPIYDAAVKGDPPVRLIDTRHEQTATFAAEATAKLTRRAGVAVLTAGPGVTNGMSAITTASFNDSPLVVLGGRAPQARWGSGSLQEFDHIPVVSPVTRRATTAADTNTIPDEVHAAVVAALTPPRGPVFTDFPLDVLFGAGSGTVPDMPPGAPRCLPGTEPDPGEVARAAELLATAERPALIVGSDVYWAGAWDELRAAAAALDVPVFANGLGRGLLPADDELSFSRARSCLRSEADLVAVLGAPLDFRLGFGRFGDAAVIHAVDHPDKRTAHADVAVSVIGDLTMFLRSLADWSGDRRDHRPWLSQLRATEAAARTADDELLAANTEPIKPSRVYGELRRVLDRDTVVVCDGGDFVSYAGRFVDIQQPGTWLDTGPFGCLGTGLGYSLAARVAYPDRQVVCLLGDGAAGFSLMDIDTLVRHNLPVVFVVGNNGIWGLEKHPMQALYGYDVAAELRPGCRYDEVVTALGGAGETVTAPGDIGAALRRAFDSGVPYLVNVLTDPTDAYPRSSNLA